LENVGGVSEADENLGSLVYKNISLIKSSVETPNQQQNKEIQAGLTRKTIDRSTSSGLKTNELLLNFEIENTKNIEISRDTYRQSNSNQLQNPAKNSNCDNSNEDDS